MKRHTIATLTALALLSACSADAEPKEDQAPSSPPSAMARSSTTPHEEPLRTDTPENTIRSWFAELELAQNTGDMSRWASLITFSCEICIQVISSVTETYSAGGSLSTPPVDVVWIKESPDRAPTNGRQFSARVLTHPMTAVLKSGAQETRYPGGFEGYEFTLTEHQESWLIVRLVRTDTP